MKEKLLTLAVALLAATGAWAQEFTFDNLKYTVTDAEAKTVELTGYETKPEGALTIPATVTNESTEYSVTSIGEWAFSSCSALTAVTIPDGVTSIGSNAFRSCSSLTAVTIPASVTNIGIWAFSWCSQLTAVTIPEGVATIGNYAFGYCSSLTAVNIPASAINIGDWVFDACTALTQINVASGNTAYCSENGILFNKDKTTLICYPAGKPQLEYTIPSSVTVIGVNAFAYCDALTQLTIPSSVTSIGEWAFDGCTALAEMTVLATVPPTVADADVFRKVDCNIPVYVPAASLAAYQAAEVWKEFNNLQGWVTINNLNYKVIDPEVGNDYAILFGYEVAPQGALNIPEIINIPVGRTYQRVPVTQIDEKALSKCNAITSVTIPDGITSIGKSAFEYCINLTKVIIGNDVTTIKESAFYYCSSLKQVTIPASVTDISYNRVFGQCTALTQIDVESGNTAYCSEDGILFNKDKTTLICYPAGKPQLEYTIPSSVTVIGVNAFAYCDALTQLTIPSSVTSIGEWAFDGCTALAEMTVLATVPPTVADADVFRKVDCNIPVYVPAASLAAYQAAEVWKEFTSLQAISSGLDTPSMPESISVYGGMLHNPEGLRVTLYDLAGRIAYDGRDAIVDLPAGVYVVRCNGATGKAVF